MILIGSNLFSAVDSSSSAWRVGVGCVFKSTSRFDVDYLIIDISL